MTLAGSSAGLETLLAEDGVVEVPFAPPGFPSRFEGPAAVAARRTLMAGLFRFTAMRDVVVHQTTDPEVAFVEYELEAVRVADGVRAAAPFAVLIRVRDGQVVLWREYQDSAAMARFVS
ncbi:phzA/B-like protein [Pseudonocardiaceae bacterium YIM PH 21723]|nr:phzA/B-like protein [Pseudonocardiaceae bacterium YIM PH 21723]